jgi:hypothetical protein
MSKSSPNRIIWVYFRCLRDIVARVDAGREPEAVKDEIVLAIVMAVAAVEAFINLFFRVVVGESGYDTHRELVLADLDADGPDGARGLKYKLNHWPPKILGKSFAWQTGVAKEFDRLREHRNTLMHFRSSHETISPVPGLEITGLADTSVYDELQPAHAADALRIAEGMVAEVLRLRDIPPERIPGQVRQWTGRLPG